ncbi:MAG: DNA-binding protein [Planctomycetes bacterium]|nr:DNA-binding protein [Planctomycetota bacterium]
MTTRAEWQQLAEDRILDAQAHLHPAVGRWSAAYYLIGYAVECGLKSCILALVGAHPEVIYEDRRFSQDVWTHDIESLVVLARLKADRDADAAANPALYTNWLRVKDWTEQSRYLQKTQAEAERLFEAVTHPNDGVMRWIRLRW